VPADFSNFAPWGDDEVERMLRLIESGSSMRDLCRALNRSEVDLEQQAQFLGVLLPEHEELSVLTRTADSSAATSTIHYAPFLQPRRLIV
jgi:hypothetical protein